jgi:hypothetical protein
MRRLMGGLTVTAGIPSAAVATGLALTGANEDQIDAYKRSFAAPWEKTATLVPTGTDANGNITSFYNFSYTNPYDYIRRPFEAVSLAISNGNRNEASLLKIANDAAFSSVSEIVSPFIEPSMGFQAISEATQGQTSTGKIIFNESDNLGDKAVKGFAHVLNQVSPTVSPFNVSVDAAGIRFIPKDFATAAAGIITRQDDLMSAKGRPLDVGETMVSAFSGIKIIKPQLERSLYYKSSEANRAIRETTNEFNRLLRSSDIRTAEDYIKGYINSNEKRYNSLRDLYNAIEDARTLGLSDYEIDAQLKKARVASRDLVMRGIFRPLFPQEDLISEAVIAGKDIRGIYGEQARLEGQFLTGQFPKAPPEPTVQRVGGASEVLRQQEVNKLLTGQP